MEETITYPFIVVAASSSSSWSSDCANGVGFFERTSITDSVPSPLRAIQPSVLQFFFTNLPCCEKMMLVRQPQKVGDVVKVLFMRANSFWLPRVPELRVPVGQWYIIEYGRGLP